MLRVANHQQNIDGICTWNAMHIIAIVALRIYLN